MDPIKLEHPIETEGRTLSEITMRRAKVKDMRLATAGAKGDDAMTEIRLFANLCDVSPDAIESLDLADYAKLQERFRSFTG